MIVNEVIQWTALIVMAVLMLGVLRQVSVMLPFSAQGSEGGPAAGRRAPSRLLSQLQHAVANPALEQGAMVAFVTEDCIACQRLLADVSGGRQKLNGQPLVLVALRPSEKFRAALDATGIPVIHDDGVLWQDCHVTATPLVVQIDGRGRTATKEVTHRVDALAKA